MCFDFVEVDLSKVFEAGQAYVAVSRANLNVLRITACKGKLPQISQIVQYFYSKYIITSSELNLNEVTQYEKKRDVLTLPMVNIDECIYVPSTANEPQIFLIQEQFPPEIPEDIINKIQERVQKECEVCADVSLYSASNIDIII